LTGIGGRPASIDAAIRTFDRRDFRFWFTRICSMPPIDIAVR